MLQRSDDVFAALHREHRTRVFSYIYRRVSSRESAEELTNDVFRIAWQRNPSASDMTSAWLLTVARNVIGNEYRRRERAEHLMQRVRDSVVIAARAGHGAQQQAVADSLMRLREKDREVLLLAYWDDLSITEIGEVLGCSASAAKVRLHRARAAFAQMMPAALMAEEGA
ncbi:sigma-70 family RNA polymerase sigma factor [Arthrobacter sp. JZ12]|uniref:RNA polymerase sigma factor n=1 Tax=Arthrobacter sp. JZ12 TaxID=2654190 RepID=UPI002B4A0DA4|nr:sigma-70 family RNA polymerase sigma factor [Arthrobacter sp. JZ12]